MFCKQNYQFLFPYFFYCQVLFSTFFKYFFLLCLKMFCLQNIFYKHVLIASRFVWHFFICKILLQAHEKKCLQAKPYLQKIYLFFNVFQIYFFHVLKCFAKHLQVHQKKILQAKMYTFLFHQDVLIVSNLFSKPFSFMLDNVLFASTSKYFKQNFLKYKRKTFCKQNVLKSPCSQ